MVVALSPAVLLVLGLAVFFFRPLTAAIVLGAAIAASRHSGLLGSPNLAVRVALIAAALLVGLNPAGSGTGGLTLALWYDSWLPDTWGPIATALVTIVLLWIATWAFYHHVERLILIRVSMIGESKQAPAGE